MAIFVNIFQKTRPGWSLPLLNNMVSYFMFSCRCWGKWLRRFQRQFYCDSCCGSESLLGARPDGPHRAPAETPTHNMSGLHLGRGCSF